MNSSGRIYTTDHRGCIIPKQYRSGPDQSLMTYCVNFNEPLWTDHITNTCISCVNTEAVTVVDVIENETIDLVCPQKSDKANFPIKWNKGPRVGISHGLTLDPNFRDGRFDVVGNTQIGEFNLRIRNVTITDQGSYSCIGVHGSKAFQFRLKLEVKFPPKNLSIHHTQWNGREHIIIATEGELLNLNCTVTRGDPQETLVLEQNGRVVATGIEGTLNYQFIPLKKDHLELLICIADSAVLKNPLTETVKLKIRHKPEVLIASDSPIQMAEGNFLILQCTTHSYPEVNGITWFKDIDVYNDIVANTSRLTFIKLTKKDRGNYTCIAANDIGKGQSTVTLLVHSMEERSEVLFFASSFGPPCLFLLLVITIFLYLRYLKKTTTLPTEIISEEPSGTEYHNYYDIEDEERFRNIPRNSASAIDDSNSSSINSNYDEPDGDPTTDNDGYLNPYTGLVDGTRQAREYETIK